jgi:hypothetical protein
VRVFFSRERQLQQHPVHRRPADGTAGATVELPRDLLVGEVRLLFDDRTHDVVLVGPDARRVPAASRPPHECPRLALQALPPANGCLADLEERRRFLVRHPSAVERGDDTLAKIDRVRPPHCHLPSKPGGSRSKTIDHVNWAAL